MSAAPTAPSQYETFMRHVFDHGVSKTDRTGTGTRSVFGYQMRFPFGTDFRSSRQKSCIRARSSTNFSGFCAASRMSAVCRPQASRSGTNGRGPDGELGPVYGVQWRSWPTPGGGHIDQIAQVLQQIRTNPDSRRLIVSAWNVSDIPQMALPPCHLLFQFYVAPGETAHRPAQLPALPALLRHLPRRALQHRQLRAAHAHGRAAVRPRRRRLRLDRRRLPHLQQPLRAGARAAVARAAAYPQLVIKRKPPSLFDYAYEDFEIVGYEPHPHIKAPVAV